MTVRPSTSRPVVARGVGQPVARDDGGDERRDADEEGVDGEDLREESAPAHLDGVVSSADQAPSVYAPRVGWWPHPSLYFVKY